MCNYFEGDMAQPRVERSVVSTVAQFLPSFSGKGPCNKFQITALSAANGAQKQSPATFAD